MKPFLVRVILLLVTATGLGVGQTLPEAALSYSQLPNYPRLALLARIKGSVKLAFRLDKTGEVADVQVVSGHPILTPAAVAVVKTWRFDMPRDLYRSEWRYETEFVYRLSGKEVQGQPTLTVSLNSFHRVEILSDVFKGVIQSECSHGPCPKQ